MNLKLKDYLIVTTISLTPFLFLLIVFKYYFSDKIVIDDKIFLILIILCTIILIITFIFSLFYVLEDIHFKKEKLSKKIIQFTNTILFNLLYLPVYYIKNSLNKNIFYGLTFVILDILLISLSFNIFENKFLNYMSELDKKNIVISEKYYYRDKNNLFRIKIDTKYVCNNDLGDYKIACDNQNDDSFIGIYSYNYQEYTPAQLNEVDNFHLLQTESYIKEAGYEYSIIEDNDLKVIMYDEDMSVFYKVIDYDINNDQINDYHLIVIKEVLYTDNAIIEFNELINNIEFNKNI